MDKMIELKKVTKVFKQKTQNFTVCKDITLSIGAGEFFVFVGPSGCGKSTLLRMMSRLENGYTGSIRFDDSIDSSDVAFVFQQFGLLPWLTVYKNIEFALLSRKMSEEDRKLRITRELKRFGLTRFANVFPRELSGGLKQRVGIARALAVNPKIIFLDEPFSELDSFTAEELRLELLRVWESSEITIVMITHLIEEAIELADRIAVLTPRPARIEKVIINRLARPRAKRTSEFFELEDKLYRLVKP